MDLADFVIVPDSVEVSACKIGEIVGDLLGHRYSHATVSRVTEVVQERVQAFRERCLKPRYAVIYLFGRVVCEGPAPEAGIRKESVHVALGPPKRGGAKS